MVKLLVVSVFLLLLAGCNCPDGNTIYQDNLETTCNGLPCGFILEAGSASVGTTYHAGEHGIRIETASAVRKDFDVSANLTLTPETVVRWMALCDKSTSFEMVVGFDKGTTDILEISPAGTLSPFKEPAAVNEILFPLGTLGPTTPFPERLRSLRLETLGPGGCTLDDLWIYLPIECGG